MNHRTQVQVLFIISLFVLINGLAIFFLGEEDVSEQVHQVSINSATELKTTLEIAKKEKKNVFLHFGGPSCIWCVRLSKFLSEDHNIFDAHYVVIHSEDQALRESLDSEKGGGIPWIVILNPKGEMLTSSNTQMGERVQNIGFPASLEGRKHFRAMLLGSSTMTSSEIRKLEEALINIEKVLTNEKQDH